MADGELRRRLRVGGAVVIEGPKACGKTEMALRVAGSSVMLDVDARARQAVELDPSLVIDGAAPRLIDEWQLAPSIWNHVRREVDARRKPGQFLLTGSSVPEDDVSRHTGAGRFSFLRLRPMSLFETGHSTGAISLHTLLDGGEARSADTNLTVPALADRVVAGGWPIHLEASAVDASLAARDYLKQMAEADVSRVSGASRDPARVMQLLRSLARNVATEASISTLARDAGGAEAPMARDSVYDYLEVLNRLMILEDQPAWAPHLHSKARLRKSSKRHFIDPALAAAAVAATPERLIKDLNFLGLLFESLVIRDLRIYSQGLDGEVLHYRDSNGQEVDAIVQLADGRWAAFEVKMGLGRVDEGAASLLRFSEIVDTAKCGEPVLLGVITGTGYGYRRTDGVRVIPIGALGP